MGRYARLLLPLLFAPALLLAEEVRVLQPLGPLAEDGVHDTTNQAFPLLQEPLEALGQLPRDVNGNVAWVKALQDGHIAPRTGLTGKEKMGDIDLDIVMTNTASLPHVLFSHKIHTQWLTCSNCHSSIFLPQKGGNFVTMAKILEGEFCGVCHGKVAFSTLECNRCHSQGETRTGLR